MKDDSESRKANQKCSHELSMETRINESNTAQYCYLFDVTRNGVKITDVIEHDALNIHNDEFDEVYEYGEQRNDSGSGDQPEKRGSGQKYSIERVTSASRAGQGGTDGRLDQTESDGNSGGNLQEVQSDGKSVTFKFSRELSMEKLREENALLREKARDRGAASLTDGKNYCIQQRCNKQVYGGT